MKKSFIAISTSLVLLGSVSGAYASVSNQNTTAEVSVEQEQKNQESRELNGSGSVAPDNTVTPIYNVPLGSTNMTQWYYVNPGFGWVKVYVQNKGTSKIAVSLKTVSTNKPVLLAPSGSTNYQITNYVYPGQSVSLYNNIPTGTGDHNLNLTSSTSMAGSVSVKISEYQSDLN